MEIKDIVKLKESDYTLLKCMKCDFKVYMEELKIFKECGQCGSKSIEVIK
jgi:Zn finger protein HypA/HybF involved in hydrogenase expression